MKIKFYFNTVHYLSSACDVLNFSVIEDFLAKVRTWCRPNKSSSGDEIPERDVTYHLLCLLLYHWTTTHVYFPNIFISLSRLNDNCYISNGRTFTKSALRILLLSTFRVSRINYSLASSLPIHTRSSAHAEGPRAHCQLKSCKMLNKCSTDCIWKSLQPVNDLHSHSKPLPWLPFDRAYTISY